MEKAIYENGIVNTLEKPFSACWIVCSPHDNSNLIVGETDKVKTYWGSLEDSFDFEWCLFHSKEEMETGIKEITKEPAPSGEWMLFNVEDCENRLSPHEQNVGKPIMEQILDVTYVSVWDGGFEIETKAKFNRDTMQVFDIESVEGIDDEGDEVEVLEEEYILLPDGTKFYVEEDGGKYIAY